MSSYSDTLTQAAVERFITNLAAAMNKRLARETAQAYCDRIARWNLTEEQLASVCSHIVADKDAWPSLHEIYPYLLRAKLGKASELAPVWATMQDREGRWFAAKTGEFQELPPPPWVYRKWREEQIHGEEAWKIFSEAFLKAGGLSSKLTMIWNAINAKPEERRHLDGFSYAENKEP